MGYKTESPSRTLHFSSSSFGVHLRRRRPCWNVPDERQVRRDAPNWELRIAVFVA